MQQVKVMMAPCSVSEKVRIYLEEQITYE